MIEIQIRDQQMAEIRGIMQQIPKQMPTVMRSAINRTTTRISREIVQRTTRLYRLQRRPVVARIKLGPRAERNRLNRRISIGGRPIGLINFAARQNRQGTAATILRGGARKLYRSAFIAVGRRGNRHVFQRTSAKRLPIKTLYGPSLRDIFAQDLRDDVIPLANEMLMRFTREGAERVLRRRMGGGSA